MPRIIAIFFHSLVAILTLGWSPMLEPSLLTPQNQHDSQIEVRLVSPIKHTVKSGENFEIGVEIWNIGTEPVYVCSDFNLREWPLCSVTILVEDSSGQQYGSNVHVASDFDPLNKRRLSTVISTDWVLLPPRHFYGSVMTVDADSYQLPNKPGIYRVFGRYQSSGLVTGYHGTVTASEEEVANLPAKSWRGKIESNSISIRVVGHK